MTSFWLSFFITISMPIDNSIDTGARYYFAFEPVGPRILNCRLVKDISPESLISGPLLIDHKAYGYSVAINYDTNRDMLPDVSVFWAPGTTMPHAYWFDTDYDGRVDVIFKDLKMTGDCDGLDLRWVRTEPDQDPFDVPKRKTIN